jgi:hypothetical protein
MHKIPVAGVGGTIFAVGIIVLALLGLPIAKWFLAGAVILGVGVVGSLRLFRKLHPQTEVERVQFNVGRQMRQPWISSRSNESRFDAEHWVGCAPAVAFDLVFFESNAKADSELPYPLRRGLLSRSSLERPVRTNFDNWIDWANTRRSKFLWVPQYLLVYVRLLQSVDDLTQIVIPGEARDL